MLPITSSILNDQGYMRYQYPASIFRLLSAWAKKYHSAAKLQAQGHPAKGLFPIDDYIYTSNPQKPLGLRNTYASIGTTFRW